LQRKIKATATAVYGEVNL